MCEPFKVGRAGAPPNQRHEGGYIVDVPISVSPAEVRGSGRKPIKDHRQLELRYLKVPWEEKGIERGTDLGPKALPHFWCVKPD